MTNGDLESTWKRVIDHWDDAEAHGAFLRFCRDAGLLSDAAARYRGMAGDRDRSEVARKQLAAVTMLAMQSLETARSSPAKGLPRWVTWLISVLFVSAALYCWRQLSF